MLMTHAKAAWVMIRRIRPTFRRFADGNADEARLLLNLKWRGSRGFSASLV